MGDGDSQPCCICGKPTFVPEGWHCDPRPCCGKECRDKQRAAIKELKASVAGTPLGAVMRYFPG